jgi:hypothetical protein
MNVREVLKSRRIGNSRFRAARKPKAADKADHSAVGIRVHRIRNVLNDLLDYCRRESASKCSRPRLVLLCEVFSDYTIHAAPAAGVFENARNLRLILSCGWAVQRESAGQRRQQQRPYSDSHFSTVQFTIIHDPIHRQI